MFTPTALCETIAIMMLDIAAYHTINAIGRPKIVSSQAGQRCIAAFVIVGLRCPNNPRVTPTVNNHVAEQQGDGSESSNAREQPA